jgi:hypothetical protein
VDPWHTDSVGFELRGSGNQYPRYIWTFDATARTLTRACDQGFVCASGPAILDAQSASALVAKLATFHRAVVSPSTDCPVDYGAYLLTVDDPGNAQRKYTDGVALLCGGNAVPAGYADALSDDDLGTLEERLVALFRACDDGDGGAAQVQDVTCTPGAP